MNNSLYRNFRQASLMLIFMISAGALAVILAGCYFIIANEGLLSGELVRQSKRLAVEQAADAIVKSELERLGMDYIANDTTQTLATYSAASYESEIDSALSWGIDNGFASSVSSVNVTLPDTGSYPMFSKSNSVSKDTQFAKNPLWRFSGYNADGSVDTTITLADSGKNISYSRDYTFYREIPVGSIPFTAAYQFRGADLLYDTTLATETSYGSDYILPAFYASGYDYGTPYTDPYFGSVSLGSVPMYRYPNMVSTWGIEPTDICTYYSSSPSTNAGYQNYSLDANAIVVEFDGSSLSVLSSPYGSTSIPSAMAISSFQGQNRVVIDMDNMPITGNYEYLKWYIHCSSAEAKSAGIVIDDTSTASAADSLSITTNGHLYIWNLEGSTNRTPCVYGSNYGSLGLATTNYNGSGMSDADGMEIYPTGFISAYSQQKELVHDTFNRSGSLGGSTPDTINTESVSWGTVTGTMTCSTTGGGQLVSAANATENYCPIAIPQEAQSAGAITFSMEIDATGAGENLWLILGDSSVFDMDNRMVFRVISSVPTFQFYEKWGGTTYNNNLEDTANTFPVNVDFTYFPGASRILIRADGVIVIDQYIHSTNPGFIPNYAFLYLLPGAGGSISVKDFKIVKNAFSTVLHSPQTGSNSVEFTGSLAVGEGIGNLLNADTTINVLPTKAVTEEIEGLCERVLVHYPHFRKP